MSLKPKRKLIDRQLIVADKIEGGFTWTLASKLGAMLRSAEDKYGNRDRSYSVLGFEFSKGRPRIWYPGDCGNIVIQLSIDCLREPNKAYYQLAHECIHLLSPTGGSSANFLEEGLATHFSQDYLSDPKYIEGEDSQKYRDAQNLVEKLLDIDGDSIKRLRKIEPSLCNITKKQILNICPTVAVNTAIELTKRF